MTELKIVRTTSGDMICGEFRKSNDEIATIKNPLFIVVTQNGPAFVPILEMISNDEEIDFSLSNVFTVINPSPEVAKHYKEHFSVIETPNKKLIY